jgi:small-conductance mechanosensitive channel
MRQSNEKYALSLRRVLLDFRLLVWTNRPRLHTQMRSDINYRIEKLFREAGIEIPFPQTELRLREGALHLDTGDRFIADGKSADRELS